MKNSIWRNHKQQSSNQKKSGGSIISEKSI